MEIARCEGSLDTRSTTDSARGAARASARSANVVRAVCFAVWARRADGDGVAVTAHAEAAAPSVVFARGAIEEVLFFELAERRTAFAVLRTEVLRGDLNLVRVAA